METSNQLATVINHAEYNISSEILRTCVSCERVQDVSLNGQKCLHCQKCVECGKYSHYQDNDGDSVCEPDDLAYDYQDD